MSAIHITGLFRMPGFVQQLRPSHLVSIIQPEFQPRRPPEIEAERHLRVEVHDISEDDGLGELVQIGHIRRLVAFLRAWDQAQGDLLVHCYAGVSRSSATGLLARVLKTGDVEGSALALRRAVPYALPNRRIVALADEELELDGALIEAVHALDPPGPLPHEEVLATLELD